MRDAGIFDGAMLVVDKPMRPTSGHVVLAVLDNEFTGKTYRERAGRARLKASDPTYPDIVPTSSRHRHEG